MQVFKAAVAIALRHPLYLLVYAVGLSLMGVLMAGSLSFGEGDDAPFEAYRATFSVIDRDDSEISRGLAECLRARGAEVPLDDTEIALQDAVAKGRSECVLIVPEGFGQALIDSARAGGETPTIETVYSYSSLEGSLLDQEANEYASLARAWAAMSPDSPPADIAAHAERAMGESAQVDTVQIGGGAGGEQRFVFYLAWGTYTLFASIVVCVGLVMGTLNRTDLHRRNLVSPLSATGHNLQVAAAALVVTAGVWLFTTAVGLVAFAESAAQVSTAGLALMLALSFAFATVPLCTGYLLGQLGVSEMVGNAVGNIAGMAVSFLGGVWVSFDLLDPAVQAIGRFSPAYWYTDALQRAAVLEAPSLDALAPILGNLGVLLLFSAALFSAALVASRLRAQSADAGGNAGAARARG